MIQEIIKSTGDWERDKYLLKEKYGNGRIPTRVVASMIGEDIEFIYWLAQSGKLGTRKGHSYHIHLPQLIAYIEGAYSAASIINDLSNELYTQKLS